MPGASESSLRLNVVDSRSILAMVAYSGFVRRKALKSGRFAHTHERIHNPATAARACRRAPRVSVWNLTEARRVRPLRSLPLRPSWLKAHARRELKSSASSREELTNHQSSTLRFRREVADRFGVLPNFFCSADAAPGLVDELWKFAKSAYLDSPLPALFKERLFVHLSRFCEIRYCIVRHVGFLIGQGRPAGDADAEPETIDDVVELLRRPLPEGPALATILERLERASLGGRLPEPRTESETDLFDALTIMFLAPRGAARARAAVRAAVGDATFELLVAYLAFIRTAHYWTEMHPELTYEPDMAEILRGYKDLADLLLDTSEAELVQGGVRLRETLNQLKRVEVALQESESRQAFLLRLGDALRLLVDPVAIQGEASRLLGERLLTDRAYYADINEAQGYILVQRDFVRAGVSSKVGRYSLSDFNWVGSGISSRRSSRRSRHENLAVDSRSGSSRRRRDRRRVPSLPRR